MIDEIQELKDEISALMGAKEAVEQDRDNVEAELRECEDDLKRARELLQKTFAVLEDITGGDTILGTDLEDEIGFTEYEYEAIKCGEWL